MVAVGQDGRRGDRGTANDIEVDADTSTLGLRITNVKTPITLRVDEPVYFASLISLATTLDERPKSFT